MYAYLGLISSFASFPGAVGCAGYVVGGWVRENENKAILIQLKLEFWLSLTKTFNCSN